MFVLLVSRLLNICFLSLSLSPLPPPSSLPSSLSPPSLILSPPPPTPLPLPFVRPVCSHSLSKDLVTRLVSDDGEREKKTEREKENRKKKRKRRWCGVLIELVPETRVRYLGGVGSSKPCCPTGVYLLTRCYPFWGGWGAEGFGNHFSAFAVMIGEFPLRSFARWFIESIFRDRICSRCFLVLTSQAHVLCESAYTYTHHSHSKHTSMNTQTYSPAHSDIITH